MPPLRRRIQDRASAALLNGEVRGRAALPVVVVVEVKALIEVETGIERKRRDEGPARITRGTQTLGHGLNLVVQHVSGVLPHAVLVRIETGEDVDVGGEGDDVVSVRV